MPETLVESSTPAIPEPHPHIILDIHTHHPAPQPEGIVSMAPSDLPEEGKFPFQLYSTGIHPWNLEGMAPDTAEMEVLRQAADRKDVVAIGETGIDQVHPNAAPLAAQINLFRSHVELSEELKKPLIIHCVKAFDKIIGIKKDMKPSQQWIIHGFRGKPSVLNMVTAAGIAVSFGGKFNPESLLACPADMIFAETDDAPARIQDVIATLNTVREDMTPDLLRRNFYSCFNSDF